MLFDAPKPYKKRVASTHFVRCASADFIDIKQGIKSEFRSPYVLQAKDVDWPWPAVCYRLDKTYGYASCLIILEEMWREPLGAITMESIRSEGFRDFDEYRRSWVNRHHKRFPPEKHVTAYRFRPWQEGDLEIYGTKILKHLYGEWL